jgi:hypothetical protein
LKSGFFNPISILIKTTSLLGNGETTARFSWFEGSQSPGYLYIGTNRNPGKLQISKEMFSKTLAVF